MAAVHRQSWSRSAAPTSATASASLMSFRRRSQRLCVRSVRSSETALALPINLWPVRNRLRSVLACPARSEWREEAMHEVAAVGALVDAVGSAIAAHQPCRVDAVRVRRGSTFAEEALVQ